MNNAATADLTALIRRLDHAADSIKDASEKILDETANSIYELMVSMAPVRTGRLRTSIRIVSAPGMRTIGPQGVDYAAYQEFGTGIRGEFPTSEYIIRPRQEGGRLVFKIDGKWVSTREVHHPGIPPNPYVRPAARQGLSDLEDRYQQTGARLITVGAA